MVISGYRRFLVWEIHQRPPSPRNWRVTFLRTHRLRALSKTPTWSWFPTPRLHWWGSSQLGTSLNRRRCVDNTATPKSDGVRLAYGAALSYTAKNSFQCPVNQHQLSKTAELSWRADIKPNWDTPRTGLPSLSASQDSLNALLTGRFGLDIL